MIIIHYHFDPRSFFFLSPLKFLRSHQRRSSHRHILSASVWVRDSVTPSRKRLDARWQPRVCGSGACQFLWPSLQQGNTYSSSTIFLSSLNIPLTIPLVSLLSSSSRLLLLPLSSSFASVHFLSHLSLLLSNLSFSSFTSYNPSFLCIAPLSPHITSYIPPPSALPL